MAAALFVIFFLLLVSEMGAISNSQFNGSAAAAAAVKKHHRQLLLLASDPTFTPSPRPSSPPSPAPTPTKGPKATFTFSYTGSVQQWVVPVGVATFTVDAYGAAGGNYLLGPIYPGGLGGYISVIDIAASSFVGQTLFIYVGAAGAFYAGYNAIYTPGLGGGGGEPPGGSGDYTSGGGASDLRTNTSDLSSR